MLFLYEEWHVEMLQNFHFHYDTQRSPSLNIAGFLCET